MPAKRPATKRPCIVMSCADMLEADQVGQQLHDFDNGCLITYRRAQDIVMNAPAAKVALVILAGDETSSCLAVTLKWLRRRWPSCPITVVGEEGCSEYEMTAREGGAIYLTRPVESQQWSAILAHALAGQGRVVTEG